ncbi:hypothetical protein VTP01DRAFT_10945 [Rhizomucor pusillus]|uniref:mitochondrial 54S ribosomal protein mL57 n=1 Tax=Rhizomucor pusillus TaxID=4840 RepID=UPI003743E503
MFAALASFRSTPARYARFYSSTLKSASAEFDQEAIASKLGFSIRTPGILQQALTHKSFKHDTVPSNERLEYLGQRVLTLLVTEHQATNASNAEQLKAAVDEKLDHDRLKSKLETLGLDKGLQYHLPKEGSKVPAKAMTAFVGAIYQDNGMEATRKFVKKYLLN